MFHRFTATAHARYESSTWTLHGVTLGSGSGWSEEAQTTYTNRSKVYKYWICGMNKSGGSAPFDDAEMVYAGPRGDKDVAAGVVPSSADSTDP